MLCSTPLSNSCECHMEESNIRKYFINKVSNQTRGYSERDLRQMYSEALFQARREGRIRCRTDSLTDLSKVPKVPDEFVKLSDFTRAIESCSPRNLRTQRSITPCHLKNKADQLPLRWPCQSKTIGDSGMEGS